MNDLWVDWNEYATERDHELMAEFMAELAAEKENQERLITRSAEWRKQFPDYCRSCGGWGGSTFTQAQPCGMGTARETLFDPCEEIDDLSICHRCGTHGMTTDDGEGPCQLCGWNYDDGDPAH